MELEIVIDKNCMEKVTVYAHEKSQLVLDIEDLVASNSLNLIGYIGETAVKLEAKDIFCFYVEANKVFALTENEKYRLKCRLYQIEENLGGSFVKINQSCIANIKKIKQFGVSVGGALTVILKNGYRDYVSRRNVKNVKERLGL